MPKKSIATLIVLHVAFFSFNALADQCRYVTKDQASKAAEVFRSKKRFFNFCKNCGDTSARGYFVESASYEPVDDKHIKEPLFEVLINKNGVTDFAYSYVKVDGKYENVAMLAGCPVKGVDRYLDPILVDAVLKKEKERQAGSDAEYEDDPKTKKLNEAVRKSRDARKRLNEYRARVSEESK